MSTWAMISFQDSASPSMEQLLFFHDLTMATMTLVASVVATWFFSISLFSVTNRFLLQNHMVETIWTMCPVIILLIVTLPSLSILYTLGDPFSPNMTLKAVGHQWYWSYEYSDFDKSEYDSYMMPMDTTFSANRLLETDNSVVLPTNTYVRLITSASDVIHAWTVPALGLKSDAIPGRLNQMTFLINRPGLFYGQCSEICGSNHSFMPIKIEATPMKFFISWLSS